MVAALTRWFLSRTVQGIDWLQAPISLRIW